MGIGRIVIGAIVLLFGRKLFWLLIALVGFLLGYEIATTLFADLATWVVFLLAVALGLLGAVVAIGFQRLAFALAGFYAGGYIALRLAAEMGPVDNAAVYFVVGGLVGGILAALIMERAIILLSSLVGAGSMVQGLNLQGMNLQGAVSAAVFVGLVIVGVLVQSRQLAPRPRQD